MITGMVIRDLMLRPRTPLASFFEITSKHCDVQWRFNRQATFKRNLPGQKLSIHW